MRLKPTSIVEKRDINEKDKLITLVKIPTFDKSDHRPLNVNAFFVNFEARKHVKINYTTKNVRLITELRTIVLNKLGLEDSSSFVLSFRGKTLPLGDTLISDTSIGLLPFGTVTLLSEQLLIGGGNVCSVCNIRDDDEETKLA